MQKPSQDSVDTSGMTQDPPFEQVASALRRLFQACGTKAGVDCLHHAALGQALLRSLGYESTVRIGFAAWRVGPGDGDVILHAPVTGMAPLAPHSVPFHAWIEFREVVFDPTAYQLPLKARMLDLIDGGTTDIAWAPEYLAISRDQVQTLHTVRQADTGMVYYDVVPSMETVIKSTMAPIDDEELELLTVIFRNPDTHVIGPNNVPPAKLAA